MCISMRRSAGAYYAVRMERTRPSLKSWRRARRLLVLRTTDLRVSNRGPCRSGVKAPDALLAAPRLSIKTDGMKPGSVIWVAAAGPGIGEARSVVYARDDSRRRACSSLVEKISERQSEPMSALWRFLVVGSWI